MCSACGSGPARAPWETEAHGATPRHHRRRAEQATELLGGRATVKPYGACGYLLVGPTGTTKVAQDLDGLIALVDTPASRRLSLIHI